MIKTLWKSRKYVKILKKSTAKNGWILRKKVWMQEWRVAMGNKSNSELKELIQGELLEIIRIFNIIAVVITCNPGMGGWCMVVIFMHKTAIIVSLLPAVLRSIQMSSKCNKLLHLILWTDVWRECLNWSWRKCDFRHSLKKRGRSKSLVWVLKFSNSISEKGIAIYI